MLDIVNITTKSKTGKIGHMKIKIFKDKFESPYFNDFTLNGKSILVGSYSMEFEGRSLLQYDLIFLSFLKQC